MKRGWTKARLIETMALLLQTQGFRATTLNQLIRDSGTPKGSMYFHFPQGKEELACAALDKAGHAWRKRLSEAMHEARSPAQIIAALCRVMGESLVASGYAEGSPLATVALEAATISLRVQETCAQHYAAWEEIISHRFQQFGMEAARASALATTVLSAIEGALVLCRVYRNRTPLERVSLTLASLVPEAPLS